MLFPIRSPLPFATMAPYNLRMCGMMETECFTKYGLIVLEYGHFLSGC